MFARSLVEDASPRIAFFPATVTSVAPKTGATFLSVGFLNRSPPYRFASNVRLETWRCDVFSVAS